MNNSILHFIHTSGLFVKLSKLSLDKELKLKLHVVICSVVAGVISRGLRAPLLKSLITLGGSAPLKNSCIGLAFQSLLTLLPKYYLLL